MVSCESVRRCELLLWRLPCTVPPHSALLEVGANVSWLSMVGMISAHLRTQEQEFAVAWSLWSPRLFAAVNECTRWK